jgi:hypothetical protein
MKLMMIIGKSKSEITSQNEFDLADQLGNKYKFCFVSLHEESKSASFLFT